MTKRSLGTTDISVSRLCFGTLTFSPLQKNLSASQAAALMRYAFERGVNFFDTAMLYDNYAQLAAGLKLIGKNNAVIASKSYAYDAQTARADVEAALTALERDYIDIWLMHEQESVHTLRGHAAALSAYHEMKAEGKLRAVGISTHFVAAVRAASVMDTIDIIHPIYNCSGIGVQGGSAADMLSAIQSAHSQGKGIYGMKVFGGGHLLADRQRAFDHMLGLDCFDALAIGMQSTAEIDYNVDYVNSGRQDDQLAAAATVGDKQLMIHDWCTRCQNCVSACQHNALHLDAQADRIVIDHRRCVRCGYCSTHCPEFCIKVI